MATSWSTDQWKQLKAAFCNPANADQLRPKKSRYRWLAQNVIVGDQPLGEFFNTTQIKTKISNEKNKKGVDAADLLNALNCMFFFQKTFYYNKLIF